MFLEDFHIHSSASPDAEDTMLDMALACGERGVEHICFTDHIDLDNYLTGGFDPNHSDRWTEAVNQYETLRREGPSSLDVMLGMELGAANHYPALADSIARSTPGLDFIIASIHNLAETQDFYALHYESEEHCLRLIDKYLLEHIALSRLNCFDVIGHIGYVRRYMLRSGFKAELDLRLHGAYLEEIFKNLISAGKGIELNTSGMRHPGIAGPIPSLPILRFYRELGGEVITVGSDAHRVADSGAYVDTGCEMLRALGFKYIAFFRERTPEFIKL